MRSTFMSMLIVSFATHGAMYFASGLLSSWATPPEALAREEGVVSLAFAPSAPSENAHAPQVPPPTESEVKHVPPKSQQNAIPIAEPMRHPEASPPSKTPALEKKRPPTPEPNETRERNSPTLVEKFDEWPKVEHVLPSPESASSAGSVSASGAETVDMPSIEVNPSPIYPRASLVAREEGRVVLAVRVNIQGTVDFAKVQRSSGYDRLDQAALAAVRRWKFKPGRRNGQLAPMEVAVPVSFALRDQRSPLPRE